MTQDDLFRPPELERAPEVVVIGLLPDLRRVGVVNARHPSLGVARWLEAGVDALPRHRLVVLFATPRERMPESMLRQLDSAEQAGRLTTWRG